MISINGSTENISFPECFVSRYRTADSSALKVAVYVLMNGTADESSIAEELGISQSAAQRSVEFWKDAGLFVDGTGDAVQVPQEKPLIKARRHMTQNQIAVALLGNEDYAVLLQESQRLLGRELSASESRLLIETITECELSVPSLLMLESYWLNTEPAKNVLTRTASTAREWSELGVRTHDAAESALTLMEKRYEHAKEVASLLKTDASEFSRKERKLINKIYEDYGYDGAFISEVLIRNPDANLPYISSVLKDWNKKGYRSISDARLLSAPPASVSADRMYDSVDTESLFLKAVRKINESKEDN